MFKLHVLLADDNNLILLNRIESIRLDRIDEDETIDKLKGDITISVTTISGKIYEISMKKQQEAYKDGPYPKDLIDMRKAIVENWINLTKQEK